MSTLKPKYDVLPYSYTPADEPGALECTRAIAAALIDHAYHQTDDGSFGQQLRNALLTGRPDLHSPYQVFLADLFVTGPALDSLHLTAPGSQTGLGSCQPPTDSSIAEATKAMSRSCPSPVSAGSRRHVLPRRSSVVTALSAPEKRLTRSAPIGKDAGPLRS